MKKLVIVLMSGILLFCAFCLSVSAADTTSGSCGWSTTWVYKDGVLEISGEGRIDNYAEEKRPPWYELKDKIDKVIINEGVTEVGNYAFQHIGMSELSLPATLKYIRFFSFSGCTQLKSLYLPDSVTLIAEGAFRSCISLTEIRLSPYLENIGKNCFYYCDSMSELVIPEGVVSIGDGAFGHNAYSSVTFPSSLTSIASNAFLHIDLVKCPYGSYAESYARSNNYAIEFIGDVSGTLENGIAWALSGDTLTLSGEGAVVGEYPTFEDLLTRTVHLVVEDGITALDGDLFREFINLESVVFGKDVEMIGAFCFDSCTSLKDITFNGKSLRRIESRAFSQTALKDVALPEGVEYIGNCAFSECAVLESISLPYTVEIIGEAAFDGCDSLKSITLPQNLRSIEASTFSYCDGLEEVILHENIAYIGNSAFAECPALKEILIPGNVKSIGRDAFYNCSALINVYLEDGVERIDTNAFVLCRDLVYIRIPDSVSFIAERAFDLSSVSFDCSLDSYAFDYAHTYGLGVKGEYTDVSRTAWYYDSIRNVSLKGYMSGMGDKKFSPNSNLTRAQFVQLLFAMEGLDKADYEGETGFGDVPEGKWFSPAVKWAKDTEITSGTGDGKFDVNGMVTREQLARFMMKYAEYKDHDTSGKADISLYSDVSAVSEWAYDAVEWAVYEGIFTSTSDTSLVLAPRNFSTRAIAARVVSVFDTIINK